MRIRCLLILLAVIVVIGCAADRTPGSRDFGVDITITRDDIDWLYAIVPATNAHQSVSDSAKMLAGILIFGVLGQGSGGSLGQIPISTEVTFDFLDIRDQGRNNERHLHWGSNPLIYQVSAGSVLPNMKIVSSRGTIVIEFREVQTSGNASIQISSLKKFINPRNIRSITCQQ